MAASLIEIIKYFGLDVKIINNLTQSEILYLIRRYYSEISSSS